MWGVTLEFTLARRCLDGLWVCVCVIIYAKVTSLPSQNDQRAMTAWMRRFLGSWTWLLSIVCSLPVRLSLSQLLGSPPQNVSDSELMWRQADRGCHVIARRSHRLPYVIPTSVSVGTVLFESKKSYITRGFFFHLAVEWFMQGGFTLWRISVCLSSKINQRLQTYNQVWGD